MAPQDAESDRKANGGKPLNRHPTKARTTLMIPIDELFTDNLTDEVGQLVLNLRFAAAGKARESARRELIETAAEREYISFLGHYKRYHVNLLGESGIYRVPDNKRGHLQVFRGKLIRIACWKRSHHSDRHLVAGVVDEDQIALRLKGVFSYLR